MGIFKRREEEPVGYLFQLKDWRVLNNEVFILDNDINTISMLTKVIKDKELGEVIGKEKDGK